MDGPTECQDLYPVSQAVNSVALFRAQLQNELRVTRSEDYESPKRSFSAPLLETMNQTDFYSPGGNRPIGKKIRHPNFKSQVFI